MPKLPHITNAKIQKVIDLASDLTGDMQGIANSVDKGYVEVIDKPMEYARALSNLALSALDLQVGIFMKAALDEQKRQLEAIMRERAEPKSA